MSNAIEQHRNRSSISPKAIEFLNEYELAAQLGVSVGTIRRWRLLGRGPKFVKIGGTSVRYARSDIDEWLAEQPTGGGQV